MSTLPITDLFLFSFYYIGHWPVSCRVNRCYRIWRKFSLFPSPSHQLPSPTTVTSLSQSVYADTSKFLFILNIKDSLIYALFCTLLFKNTEVQFTYRDTHMCKQHPIVIQNVSSSLSLFMPFPSQAPHSQRKPLIWFLAPWLHSFHLF